MAADKGNSKSTFPFYELNYLHFSKSVCETVTELTLQTDEAVSPVKQVSQSESFTF